MLGCGDTIDLKKPGQSTSHLWIIITEPKQDSGVNLTSRRTHSDTTTIIVQGDHPYVTHETVVFYQDARISDVRLIDAAIAGRLATQCDPCSPTILKRIQAGIDQSPFTANKIKAFCAECWQRRSSATHL